MPLTDGTLRVTDYPIDSYALRVEEGRGAVVTLARCRRYGPWEGPDWWKIHDEAGYNLNRSGGWEWEPLPSSRTKAFYARCRWDSAEEAAAFWESLPEEVRRA